MVVILYQGITSVSRGPFLHFSQDEGVNSLNWNGLFQELHLHLRSGSLDSSLFRNTTNLIRIPITSSPSKPKIIPKCLVMNARSLAKPDALPGVSKTKNQKRRPKT